MRVEQRRLRHPGGEEGEAAGDQHAARAIGRHGAHQGPRAGIELDAFVEHPLQVAGRQALQHRHAFTQGGLEIQLAAHGPLGDRRDLGLHAREIGQLVDALHIDDRGIHVGDEQLLLAALHGLQAPVELLVGQGRFQGRAHRGEVVRLQDHVGGGAVAGVQLARFLAARADAGEHFA
jgi:hypothetical protein